jgi:hypothetical protein
VGKPNENIKCFTIFLNIGLNLFVVGCVGCLREKEEGRRNKGISLLKRNSDSKFKRLS